MIVVIGAGAAGLCALGALKRHGLEAVVLEKAPALGGVWLRNDYPGLSIHTKSFSYRFHDRPPPGKSDHATRRDILDYLGDYVDSADLGEHVRYEQSVTKIVHHDDGCVVHAIDLRTGRPYEIACSHVVCASGFSNAGTPSIPTFAGADDFQGTVLHSSDVTEATLERLSAGSERVCLLGAGKSACDIALVLADRGLADRVTWVYRKFLWGWSYDVVYSNREDLPELVGKHAEYQHAVRRQPDAPATRALARALVESGLFVSLDGEDLRIHETRQAFYKPADLARLEKVIRRRKGSVQSLRRKLVLLDDGSEIPADVLVCCTGYARGRSFPPIEPADPSGQRLLYRGMIDPRSPRVVMFTGESFFVSQLFGFSIAAEWVVDFVKRDAPPSMDEVIDQDDTALNGDAHPDARYAWLPEDRARGFDYLSTEAGLRYLTQILGDLGVGEEVAQLLYLAQANADAFEQVASLVSQRLRARG